MEIPTLSQLATSMMNTYLEIYHARSDIRKTEDGLLEYERILDDTDLDIYHSAESNVKPETFTLKSSGSIEAEYLRLFLLRHRPIGLTRPLHIEIKHGDGNEILCSDYGMNYIRVSKWNEESLDFDAGIGGRRKKYTVVDYHIEYDPISALISSFDSFIAHLNNTTQMFKFIIRPTLNKHVHPPDDFEKFGVFADTHGLNLGLLGRFADPRNNAEMELFQAKGIVSTLWAKSKDASFSAHIELPVTGKERYGSKSFEGENAVLAFMKDLSPGTFAEGNGGSRIIRNSSVLKVSMISHQTPKRWMWMPSDYFYTLMIRFEVVPV